MATSGVPDSPDIWTNPQWNVRAATLRDGWCLHDLLQVAKWAFLLPVSLFITFKKKGVRMLEQSQGKAMVCGRDCFEGDLTKKFEKIENENPGFPRQAQNTFSWTKLFTVVLKNVHSTVVLPFFGIAILTLDLLRCLSKQNFSFEKIQSHPIRLLLIGKLVSNTLFSLH